MIGRGVAGRRGGAVVRVRARRWARGSGERGGLCAGCWLAGTGKNIANDVFVAIPDTPEIDTCAPRLPSTNSKLTNTGCPSRPNPTGTFEAPISSKYGAESRCAPAARKTGAPGSGGTYTSGSTRVTATSQTSAALGKGTIASHQRSARPAQGVTTGPPGVPASPRRPRCAATRAGPGLAAAPTAEERPA